jgi:hypothetical protein
VTVREYRTFDANPGFRAELAARDVVREPVTSVAPATAVAQREAMQPIVRPEEAAQVAATTTEAALRAATGQRSHVAPVNFVPAVSEPTPSARYIAANLAAVQAADPRLVESAFGPVARRVDDSEPMRDPLAQINVPGVSRRSRILSTSLPVMATAVSISSSDRMVRHLTEDRLYDSISRVGVRGDRVAIKF